MKHELIATLKVLAVFAVLLWVAFEGGRPVRR